MDRTPSQEGRERSRKDGQEEVVMNYMKSNRVELLFVRLSVLGRRRTRSGRPRENGREFGVWE